VRGSLAVVVALLVLALPASAPAQDEVEKTLLELTVKVGPQRDQECRVVADLYRPAGATAATPAPAIMATNGFGGSKNDFSTLGPSYAREGYVFLAYSGLGFGGSGCRITLDDREHDGAAGSQLLDYLGTRPFVRKDAPGDPRVGMVGGSYGGQVQFAVAAVDDRLDTIIPQITWNDLSYSLAPNNTDLARGVTYTTPGVVKIDWPVLFFGLGTGQGLQQSLADPSHLGECPNFADEVCPSLIQGASRGYLVEETERFLRNASVSSYYDEIDIPVFLTQGQSDNLFNLNESVATYEALRARGVPVKLLWRSAGHSGGGLGRSESNSQQLRAAYETRMHLAWFDHHLKGTRPRPALDFSFFADWLPFEEGEDAAPAVGVVPSYPAGRETRLYLSGADALVADAGRAQAGRATIQEVAAPTSSGGGFLNPAAADPPGTSASWTTAPLGKPLDVVGVPRVTFSVDAPTFSVSADPAQLLILHGKLYDVAPDGSATLIRNQISAARIADPSKPVTIELPGLVHRFDEGHALRLTLSTSAATYRGGLGAGPVAIETGPGSVLTVPRLGRQLGAAGAGPFGTTRFAPAVASKRKAARSWRRPSCRRVTFRLRSPGRLKVARVKVNRRQAKVVTGRALARRVRVRVPTRRAKVVVRSLEKDGTPRRSVRRYGRCRR
jgi:predicted acyl esterase